MTEDNSDKTVRFTADDAGMDVTQSHTVNIVTGLKTQLHKNEDFSPTFGDKTVRFSDDDVAMDMTQCLTINVASNLASDSIPSVKNQEHLTKEVPSQNQPSFIPSLDPGSDNLRISLSRSNDHSSNPVTAETVSTTARSSDGLKIYPGDDLSMDMTDVKMGNILGGDAGMDLVEPETGYILGDNINMNMTEVQMGHIVEIPTTDDPLHCLLPRNGMCPQSIVLKKTENTSHQKRNEVLGPSKYTGIEMANLFKYYDKILDETHWSEACNFLHVSNCSFFRFTIIIIQIIHFNPIQFKNTFINPVRAMN